MFLRSSFLVVLLWVNVFLFWYWRTNYCKLKAIVWILCPSKIEGDIIRKMSSLGACEVIVFVVDIWALRNEIIGRSLTFSAM
jgi:hypothetical protein